jgi:hypothetical protein
MTDAIRSAAAARPAAALSALQPAARAKSGAKPQGYAAAEGVRNLAVFSPRSTPAQEEAAIARLDQVLNAKQKPPANLPRGHLLNIVV